MGEYVAADLARVPPRTSTPPGTHTAAPGGVVGVYGGAVFGAGAGRDCPLLGRTTTFST